MFKCYGSPRALAAHLAADHPLRALKRRADDALREIEPVLRALRGRRGKRTMNPVWVLNGQLLIAFYGIGSDAAFCAELVNNPLFRWFVGLRPGDIAPDWWEFARERRALAESIVGQCFCHAVLAPPSDAPSLDVARAVKRAALDANRADPMKHHSVPTARPAADATHGARVSASFGG